MGLKLCHTDHMQRLVTIGEVSKVLGVSFPTHRKKKANYSQALSQVKLRPELFKQQKDYSLRKGMA